MNKKKSPTEEEWLTCTEPGAMMEFLGTRIGRRKLRLFAISCCRPLYKRSHYYSHALDLAENVAEGKAGRGWKSDLAEWSRIASEADNVESYPIWDTVNLYFGNNSLGQNFIDSVNSMRQAVTDKSERRRQLLLLRCIVGNPFRSPSIDPSWLSWNQGTITRLAEAAYEERRLPRGTLDPDRLAVLADALEDAGCTDADILSHLRGPGPHVRGCWALDLFLGRS